ncbi:MAG: DUF1194 domain-containing protein [Hyphomicrobiales bacterium]|nr:DUF1194 domain-containing protein [Hyphomicrobiales bacterium]
MIIGTDVSASVDGREYELMVEGLADAFRSNQIGQAIGAGKNGAIGINIIQWSGFSEQEIKIDWIKVGSQTVLFQLAEKIRKMKRRYEGGATDIGGAIDFSSQLFAKSGLSSNRWVIDDVGDGPNNVNHAPNRARDKAVSSGIVINALAVTGIDVLAGYFADLVIGGEGAFVEKASDFDGFKRAIHRELLREIGNLYLF